MRTIVWFRGKDLRVSDHAPLTSALESGGEVVPLFVVDPFFFDPLPAQDAPHRMQFLVGSLASLARNIEALGSELVLVRGRSRDVVPRLVREWGATRVVAQRWTEPVGRKRDHLVAEALDVPLDLLEGELLHRPGSLRSGSGEPYAVFTPFSKCLRREVTIEPALAAPKALPPVPAGVTGDGTALPTLDELGVEVNPALVEPGERAARRRLQHFLEHAAADYKGGRDRMAEAGTSRLSQDLKFGTISPRTVWHAVARALGDIEDAFTFHNELIWREFSHSTLWDRPHLLGEPFRPAFAGFPWQTPDEVPDLWDAWVEGRTGYPVVDAASRQLLHEGFVHNRARMVAASFLTKHLRIHYRFGEAHYMKFLTDGDWAQNNAGWQWAAGCGCDAQPYFRVFNPVLQGERFDPDGDYVRRWVPELKEMPAKGIHAPWKAKAGVLEAAGVALGETYPHPVVDHATARQEFLDMSKAYLKG